MKECSETGSVKYIHEKGCLLGTNSCPELPFIVEKTLGTDGATVYMIGVKIQVKALLTLNGLT